MGWDTIAGLILQYGLPFAESLWAKLTAGKAPSQADWDELKGLAAQNATTQMLAALARAGIDPASKQGQALLAAVPT